MSNLDQSGWPKLVAPPVIRTPVALAGPKSPQAAAFYAIAEKVMEQAEKSAAAATDVIEIK